ncbi:ParB/RepB/Spo0J family partition protein [Candidatus Woesearchaeota archaeon]|nr:ParB/RepB/Spo0J family partition protein [Candidatus Woesearchaeota archaeon]
MKGKLATLRIDDLLLDQEVVNKKKVGRLVKKLSEKKSIKAIRVFYCVHEAMYNIVDGHHRVFAAYNLGITSILSIVEPCYTYECTGNTPDWDFFHVRNVRAA